MPSAFCYCHNNGGINAFYVILFIITLLSMVKFWRVLVLIDSASLAFQLVQGSGGSKAMTSELAANAWLKAAESESSTQSSTHTALAVGHIQCIALLLVSIVGPTRLLLLW